ncbi:MULTISPECIES: hypothetical protein [Ralstonia]|jgi:hypothetical protein|uniref:Uncharacterized protein n=1 Tax=Ralstonia thomasii TaxID=3058596 RepID=A0AAD2F2B1_9RALS|nr:MULTISPECIES: hypothetical protein [Ralstonia]MBT2179630.1 hypothetical protein [Ralstonia pickettii]MBX3774803.1 hypothetical protein [Ralstonia pickettii]MBX3813760.1 hypothetical protein [Ralstonia pickettii]MBX3819644.1 hypothetical protein [Ralstonia insidiosa]MBX3838083.1 hypothetical protein [Ralstonia insidiosa]
MKSQINVRRVFRDSLRMYFAPLTGAFKGIRAELRRTDREIALHRSQESREDRKSAHIA